MNTSTTFNLDYIQINPGQHILVKGKILNLWGLLYALSAFGLAVFVTPIIALLAPICDLFGDKNRRRLLDWIVHLWANLSMTLVGYRPKLIGIENLPVCSFFLIPYFTHFEFCLHFFCDWVN